MTNTSSHRNTSLDALRGAATCFMVYGNMTPLLASAPPLGLRWLISFVAPFFVIIAGMVASSSLSHAVKRSLFLFGMGALIDVAIWRIIPGTTVDILYIIALALPLVSFCMHWEKEKNFPVIMGTVIMLIFLATPFLQRWLGYTDYPSEYTLQGVLTVDIQKPTSLLNHWVIDGWFPLFPWIGFCLIGMLLKRTHLERKLFLSLPLVIIGGLLWFFFPGPHLVREDYYELFYPPTIGFFLMSVGMFLILLLLTSKILSRARKAIEPFISLGEAPMAMYLLHLLFIRYLFEPFNGSLPFVYFVILGLIVNASLLLVSWTLRRARQHAPHRPFFVKWVIG